MIHASTVVSAPAGAPAATPAAPAAVTPGATAPTPATAAKTETVQTDLSADEVRQWSSLQKANREAKSRIAELEKERDALTPLKSTAEKATALEAHIKEGKFLAAAQAAGIDIEQAFSEWLAAEQESASGPPPKELTELKEKLEKLEAKDTEAEAQRKAREAADKDRSNARDKEVITAAISDVLTKDSESETPAWELCARTDNRTEAVTEAHAIVIDAATKLGRPITEDEATALFKSAFDQLEEHYSALGKRYSKQTSATVATYRGTPRVRETVASRTIDNNRGSIRKPDTKPKPAFQSFREIREELLTKRRGN